MKVYKSPWVSRESYFVKTGAAGTSTTGYSVEFWNGKWKVKRAKYLTKDLKTMPVVAEEDGVNFKKFIEEVIKTLVLSAVHFGRIEDPPEEPHAKQQLIDEYAREHLCATCEWKNGDICTLPRCMKMEERSKNERKTAQPR